MDGENVENNSGQDEDQCVSDAVSYGLTVPSVNREIDNDNCFKEIDFKVNDCKAVSATRKDETKSNVDSVEYNENTFDSNCTGSDNVNMDEALSELSTSRLESVEMLENTRDSVNSYVSGCEIGSNIGLIAGGMSARLSESILSENTLDSSHSVSSRNESEGINYDRLKSDRFPVEFDGNTEEMNSLTDDGKASRDEVDRTDKPSSEQNESTRESSKASINGDDCIDVNSKPDQCDDESAAEDVPLAELLLNLRSERKQKTIHDEDCNISRKKHRGRKKISIKKEPLESLNIYKYKCAWSGKGQCAHCKELFTCRQSAKKHMLLKHARELMYECSYCSYRVRLKDRLSRHVASVHNKDQIYTTDFTYDDPAEKGEVNLRGNPVYKKCTYCFYEMEAKRMRSHILSVHRCNYKSYFCLYCNYKTSILVNLQEHLTVHDDLKKFVCNFCIYRTVRKRYLKRHIENRHNKWLAENSNEEPDEPEIYQCNQCAFVSCDENSLFKHIIKTHQRQWSIRVKREEDKIPISEYSKDTSISLNALSNTDVNTDNTQMVQSPTQANQFNENGQKKFFCLKCDFVTLYESLYNEHMACVHTKINDVQWYSCDYCDFTSIYSHSLKRHYETVHIKIRKRTNGTLQERPKIKSYECDFCRKIYLKKILMRRHIERDHDIDRPFNCTACDYKTAKREDLLRHMRLHV